MGFILNYPSWSDPSWMSKVVGNPWWGSGVSQPWPSGVEVDSCRRRTMEHVRTCLRQTNKLTDLFFRFISPRMEALINEEAERIRRNPHNLEMASYLDPPELPWKPTSWIVGPPGKRAAIGRGPQEDRGVMLRRPSSGRLEIKMVQGPGMRQFRLEWREQTAADQWMNFCYPTLRLRLQIVNPLDIGH